MVLSKCAVCNIKKSRLMNKQEASGSLSKFGIKTALREISLGGDVLI